MDADTVIGSLDLDTGELPVDICLSDLDEKWQEELQDRELLRIRVADGKRKVKKLLAAVAELEAQVEGLKAKLGVAASRGEFDIGYVEGLEAQAEALAEERDEALFQCKKLGDINDEQRKALEAADHLEDAVGELFLKVDGCPRCHDTLEDHGVDYGAGPSGCSTGPLLQSAQWAYQKAREACR